MCNEVKGTLYHCILECVKVESFWQDSNMIDQILEKKTKKKQWIISFLYQAYIWPTYT